jgi:serine/threonine protein phosphatase PrpC
VTGSGAGLTDVGESRDHNEDGFLIWDMAQGVDLEELSEGHPFGERPVLLAVSDGMGGAAAGEVASTLTLQALRDHAEGAMEKLAGADIPRLEAWLADGIRWAHQRVREASARDATIQGMGATLTTGVVIPGAIVMGHVGDSRAYHLGDGVVRQVTNDHTLVGQLVARGHLTEEEARHHPQRHVLLQAVGVKESVEVDSLTVLLRPGDRFLVCSDGLYDLVAEEAMAEVLAGPGSPMSQCRSLITAANVLGGTDNITVIVLHMD